MNDQSKAETPEPRPTFQPGLVEALTGAYAAVLKNQRTASGAYVRWIRPSARSHEFAWLNAGPETLLMGDGSRLVPSTSSISASVQKMMTTLELNPYERELQYGFPYVIGHVHGVTYRAPLFTIPVTIKSQGADLNVSIADDAPRFNSLPYRTEHDPGARELALSRLIEGCPDLPLTPQTLRTFCDSLVRELQITCNADLAGNLKDPPSMPTRQTALTLIDAGAIFVAPKTSYFLVSDLKTIGEAPEDGIARTALGWMIGKRPAEPTNDSFPNRSKVYFPFASNPSQRRVAHLVDDPRSRVTVVQGPPGTGKSLTIANLVCHLVARGKKVLVTSQKDKALQVVDELLGKLEMQQLPMTLLQRDRESKRQLSERLQSIKKDRSIDETQQAVDAQVNLHQKASESHELTEEELGRSLKAEHQIELADRQLATSSGFFSRMIAKFKLNRHLRHAERHAKKRSDTVSKALSLTKMQIRDIAVGLLQNSGDHRVSTANKAERQQLREFARLLGRDQANHRNFRVFDGLKADPDRCRMLLKILPCWIVSPDDVARLFPCEPGLFDVVIIDEGSQCDLPSMAPVLYRSTQAVIAGDSKQMQAQRFAFTSGQVSAQAWAEYGLKTLDPEGWLDPSRIDLLQLATVRMDEDAFLNEHYRSLPEIIDFSNHRWYDDKLRLMRDGGKKRIGDPTIGAVNLHRVAGQVTPGTQENEIEARALMKHLKALLNHPAYADASVGVICLFEEQMRLVNELVADEIGEEARAAHQLVVLNPDGFQGDERDVILYSLSFDGVGMTRNQLSARQAERAHIQGMLNVAFTRPRDEVHIFHSADISDFGTAEGKGTIKDWLAYCAALKDRVRLEDTNFDAQLAKADSQFEQQVMVALAERRMKVYSQFPCCGYFIDIVAEQNDHRIAVECDGEWVHLDEHGELRIEDIQRQEVLERAGWTVLRIPYRSWREDPASQVTRLEHALMSLERDFGDDDEAPTSGSQVPTSEPDLKAEAKVAPKKVHLSQEELAIIEALHAGTNGKEAIFRLARARLGHSRLGPKIRESLEAAVRSLASRDVLRVEEDEYFFRDNENRNANYVAEAVRPSLRRNRVFSYRR